CAERRERDVLERMYRSPRRVEDLERVRSRGRGDEALVALIANVELEAQCFARAVNALRGRAPRGEMAESGRGLRPECVARCAEHARFEAVVERQQRKAVRPVDPDEQARALVRMLGPAAVAEQVERWIDRRAAGEPGDAVRVGLALRARPR